MERFPSLHPRDVRLTPEQGGLTYDQLRACIEALDEPRGFIVPVVMTEPE